MKCLSDDLAGNYLGLIPLRNKDIQTPLDSRKRINYVFSKDEPGYIEMPTLQEHRKYMFGMTTNWCSFYKPIKIEKLKLESVMPHIGMTMVRFFGLRMAFEDGIIIFKMNDEEIGCSIMSGS